ncbi:TIGR02147 family protein [Bdellovibrio sp. HCB288]|uniref:TIGR02147 family protein n=1 Tax=Bdellovibrio sp. HCB288 TaxID=3394355 RepID=UPI0039B69DDB
MSKTGSFFHYEYIKQELAKRMQVNPHYSLRSFARDLGVGHSWLSEFLAGKKGLSDSTAEKIVQALSLSRQDAELFKLSTRAAHARSSTERERAFTELQQIKPKSIRKVKAQEVVRAGSWYHLAILELTELPDFKHHELDIAQRLRLPKPTVSRALQDLISHGHLKVENGRMQAVSAQTESDMDVPSVAIRQYHEQILQLGQRALHEQIVEQREFMSTTFAFSTERMVEAKKAIRDFQSFFAKEFYQETDNKDSVYQMSMQFFRMDKKGNGL